MDERRQLEAIYDEHAAALYCLLLNLLRDEQETRDVLHDVFRKLAADPGLIERARKPRAYLLRLAHNQAINFIRRRSAADRRVDVLAQSEPEPFAPVTDPDAAAFKSALTNALAGMAALWLIMVGFQFGSDGSNRSTGSDAGGLQASGSITAIAVLMDEELLWNDLSEFPPPQSTPAPPRKPPVQRPRSRRNSLEMGIA
ncbi:MAG: RNA polymerase sigma factor [Verrucomicrobiia bacterium]|jgi:hypothetical protein